MDAKQLYERALNLAPKGLCECRVCGRVGPLNGALVTWWAGVPFNALCPLCFSIGRRVVVARRLEGIEATVLEQESRPVVSLAADVGPADMPQTKLSRSPSEGW